MLEGNRCQWRESRRSLPFSALRFQRRTMKLKGLLIEKIGEKDRQRERERRSSDLCSESLTWEVLGTQHLCIYIYIKEIGLGNSHQPQMIWCGKVYPSASLFHASVSKGINADCVTEPPPQTNTENKTFSLCNPLFFTR